MSKKWKFANEVNIGKVGSGNCQRNEKERWLKTFRLWHSFYLWPVCHSESSSIEASAEGSRLIGHRFLVVSASVFRHLNIVFFVCQISHFIVHLLQFFIDLWLCKNKYCYQKVFAFSDPAPSLPQVLLQQLERGHLRSSQQVGHKLCCQKSCSLRKICTDVITQASQIGNINLPFFFKHQTQIAFLSIHLFCCFWEHVHFIKIDSLISRQEQKINWRSVSHISILLTPVKTLSMASKIVVFFLFPRISSHLTSAKGRWIQFFFFSIFYESKAYPRIWPNSSITLGCRRARTLDMKIN